MCQFEDPLLFTCNPQMLSPFALITLCIIATIHNPMHNTLEVSSYNVYRDHAFKPVVNPH